MARGDQLARQWRIIQMLIASRHGKTARELATDLEYHWRTVYRDLEALQVAGFPIYNERKDNSNVWMILDAAKHQVPLPMNLTEFMALYFSRDMLKILKNTVFYDSLQSFFQKLKAILPQEYINYLSQIEQNLHVGQRPYKQYGEIKEVIDHINDAVVGRKQIEIVYYSMSRKEENLRLVAPYNLWFFDGTIYLIGYCCLRKDVRLFALDRIKKLSQTDQSFDMPDDFNVQEFMKSSFGVFQGDPTKVRIWFAQNAAGYIREKTWHETQSIEEQDDGAIIFEAEVAGTDEIKFWIMSWGSKAVVLEPESLKEEIMLEAEAVFHQYESAAPSHETHS